MVAQAFLHIGNTEFAIWHNPQGHRLGVEVLAQYEWQILVAKSLAVAAIDTPHACLADAAATEVVLGISVKEAEVAVLAAEPPLAARKGDAVLREHNVLLILLVKGADAALVGMGANGIVGHTQGYPRHGLAACTTAHHLHDPCLVGVADAEHLTRTAIAIFLGQRGHHFDSLTRGLGALQSQVHERAIVDETRRVDKLRTATIGGLADGDLPLVDIANHTVGYRRLGYLAVILFAVAVDDATHLARGMGAGRQISQVAERAERVGVIGTHH